ncbi:MAG: hypothetical protein C5B54_04670 [Acidobacteria bacterium]|nr:MAG: hypothetical protein C5B54_04670 [Acidobacteriota bacterium]
MRTLIRILWVLLLGLLFTVSTPTVTQAKAVVGATVDTRNFSMLAEFGNWRNVPRFGQVWAPAMRGDWRPFFYGEWVYADDGWTWDSYEPYGWLVYHYGNWVYDPSFGWVWVPGYDYSPAPVDWVTYDDYIGWAPLPPPGFALPDLFAPQFATVFTVVPVNDFDRDDVARVALRKPPAPSNRASVRKAKPDTQMIEKVTHRKIEPLKLNHEQAKIGEKTLRKDVPNDEMAKRTEQHRAEVREKLKMKQEPKPQHGF